MKTINIGLIGLGTVGGGVARTLIEKRALLSEKAGIQIKLAKVFDMNKNRYSELKIPLDAVADNAQDIVDDFDIDILIELIGGITPASELVVGALCNGKHVVTANKALIAEFGQEIFDVANQLGGFIGFEASVCGAMPIVKILNESFSGNRLTSLHGIVNGTCNYIITKMSENNMSLAEALKEAQEKGLAEANPTLDIDGHDACHKICILAMLAFGRYFKPSDVYVEGIRHLDLTDIIYAKEWGYDIKLLAIAKKNGDSVELRVHPTLIPSSHLLSAVKNEDNAVFVKGDMIGESMVYGKGAGRYPAASAVISDVVDIAKLIRTSKIINPPKVILDNGKKLKVSKMDELVSRFYLRLQTIDKPGVLASIAGVLAKNKISIATVSQVQRKQGQAVPIVMLTHEAKESSMKKALAAIDKMGFVKGKTVRIRIEN